MNAIEAQHWRAIPGVELVVPPTHPLPRIHYSPAHGTPTALEILKRFLTAGLLVENILPMVNRNLKSARRHHERTELALLCDINEQLFWRFLARYLALNLEQRKW